MLWVNYNKADKAILSDELTFVLIFYIFLIKIIRSM
jgi:hypothetical protein